jgi:hypothetical protein
MADLIGSPKVEAPLGLEDFGIIEKILRNRAGFFEEIRDGIGLGEKLRAMLLSSTAFFGLYGAVMGSTHSLWQTLSSAVKLPVLFLATLFVCVPSLYFISLIFGSRMSLRQNLALILAAVTVTGVLLLSMAPITLFFLLTTPHYQFFKLLNVAIFAAAGILGVVFLYRGMQVVAGQELDGAASRRWVMIMWIGVYAFVGSQMAWTIRPFIGAPGVEFELFRQLGGNFYSNVLYSIGDLLGFYR